MPRGRTKKTVLETNTKKETATELRQKQSGSTDSTGRAGGGTDARHVTFVRRRPINTANIVNATY